MYLDTRESDLIQRLAAEVKPLPVGDIWIGTDDQGIQSGGLVIERKSIRDLEASILDGRYREQRGRILTFCQEKKTQPMYILEGALGSATGRLQKKALMKVIHRLIFHYQIAVMQTASLAETAELIETLEEQWKEDPASLQRTTELVKVTDGIHVQKKANSAEPQFFVIACLAQCPGISVKMSEAIVQTFGTFTAIMAATAKEIEAVQVGSRKVGPVVSKRLYELLHVTLPNNAS